MSKKKGLGQNPRTGKGNQRTRARELQPNDAILIVCEGSKTEPNYFKAFKLINCRVEIHGLGMNTKTLVAEAVEKWKAFAADQNYFNQLWCVFDRDSFPQQDYNDAFELIRSESMKINRQYKKRMGTPIHFEAAYTNEAFELWYLLHFDYQNTGVSRDQYKGKLDNRLPKPYKKNDPTMYELLENLGVQTAGRQGQAFAIENAKRLCAHADPVQPHNTNPSTTVHLLVEELNKYLKP
ncbi:RloB family protein [Myxococcota bacterium]|nr:RloB family protein [Myxococcota bacterium]MBU1534185.1 RloB family protein [Myxococcota bacterium]